MQGQPWLSSSQGSRGVFIPGHVGRGMGAHQVLRWRVWSCRPSFHFGETKTAALAPYGFQIIITVHDHTVRLGRIKTNPSKILIIFIQGAPCLKTTNGRLAGARSLLIFAGKVEPTSAWKCQRTGR